MEEKESCSSDEDSADYDDSQGNKTPKDASKSSKSKKFSPVALASLNAFFENGMVGVGENYISAIERAARDTKLSTDQIKVSDLSIFHTLTCRKGV